MGKRTLCIPVTPFGLIQWIFTVIPVVILLPVTLYGLRQSLKLKQPLFRYIYWITSVLLLIASITWSIHAFFDFDVSGYCDDWIRMMITNVLALTAYKFSLISICCLYTVRMYLSFKTTKYSISTLIFIVFALLILIQFVMVILTQYFNILSKDAFKDNDTEQAFKWAHLLFLTFNIFGGVNMVYNIILLIIFLRQIYKMISCLKEKDDNKKIGYIRDIVKPVAYYTICLFMVLISTTIVFVFSFFRGNVIVDTNSIYQINLAVVSWDILINALSINLQFDASKNILDLCCKCCNNYMVKVFIQQNNIIIADQDYAYPIAMNPSGNIIRVNTDTKERTEITSLTTDMDTTETETGLTTCTSNDLQLRRTELTKFGGPPSWIVK
eukprot:198029_1